MEALEYVAAKANYSTGNLSEDEMKKRIQGIKVIFDKHLLNLHYELVAVCGKTMKGTELNPEEQAKYNQFNQFMLSWMTVNEWYYGSYKYPFKVSLS